MTTPNPTFSDAVARAVAELESNYPGSVTAEADGEGGAFVVVTGLPVGRTYRQRSTWVGFHVTFQYPYADVYPHYVRLDLARRDGAALGDGMSPTEWRGLQVIQISRRSNQRDPGTETALIKLDKVIEWLRTR